MPPDGPPPLSKPLGPADPRLVRTLDDPAYRWRVGQVRDRLKGSGVTQRAMAARVGVGETHVYNVLRLMVAGRPTLARIEAALDADEPGAAEPDRTPVPPAEVGRS